MPCPRLLGIRSNRDLWQGLPPPGKDRGVVQRIWGDGQLTRCQGTAREPTLGRKLEGQAFTMEDEGGNIIEIEDE